MAIDALNHIEKTLADSYRKEIDQEENVWRSLPFFATTVALQIAALAQFINHLPRLWTICFFLAAALLALTGVLMLIALVLLIQCIYPAPFQYIAREPELLRYAHELSAAEKAAVATGTVKPPKALEILQSELAAQYGVGADNNRQINKRRELRRARAGIFIICSMITTVFLVVILFVNYYISPVPTAGVLSGQSDAASQSIEGKVGGGATPNLLMMTKLGNCYILIVQAGGVPYGNSDAAFRPSTRAEDGTEKPGKGRGKAIGAIGGPVSHSAQASADANHH